jgi:hypothetical protein
MDTDIRMTQLEFESLDDAALIWRCVEPSIREVRGKDPNTKSRAMQQLNSSQRALFLFQVLYGHAGNGAAAFFTQIAYLAETLDFFSALKSAMKNHTADVPKPKVLQAIQFQKPYRNSRNTLLKAT